MQKLTAQAIYLSHGGGPLPLLGDAAHNQLVQVLADLGQAIKKPKAVILVSAHWEAAEFRITAQPKPDLLYDYYGFPEESYNITYPAPGLPALGRDIHAALTYSNLPGVLDNKRGFDHGMFVPMKIMFPAADIPCVQISLHHSLDASYHIQLGKALKTLLTGETLLIGSGFSFHNMRAFFNENTGIQENVQFEAWLQQTCGDKSLPENQREQLLSDWSFAPGAKFCHPREEHLLPLHVCYGAIGKAYRQAHQVHVLNKKASVFVW